MAKIPLPPPGVSDQEWEGLWQVRVIERRSIKKLTSIFPRQPDRLRELIDEIDRTADYFRWLKMRLLAYLGCGIKEIRIAVKADDRTIYRHIAEVEAEQEALRRQVARRWRREQRMPIQELSRRLGRRKDVIKEWVADLELTFDETARFTARRLYSEGKTITEIAEQIKSDVARAKGFVEDLHQAELDRLAQLVTERPEITLAELAPYFPRWSERTIARHREGCFPTTDSDCYLHGEAKEPYYAVGGLERIIGFQGINIQSVVEFKEVAFLRVMRIGEIRPQRFYSLADLLAKHPLYKRQLEIGRIIAQNQEGMVAQKPKDLTMREWLILLTMLVFRARRWRWPDWSELAQLLTRYQYSESSLFAGRRALIERGYLAEQDDVLLATPKCPVGLISHPPQAITGTNLVLRVYYDFVDSMERAVVLRNSSPSRSLESLDAKERWNRHFQDAKQERYEAL